MTETNHEFLKFNNLKTKGNIVITRQKCRSKIHIKYVKCQTTFPTLLSLRIHVPMSHDCNNSTSYHLQAPTAFLDTAISQGR